MVSACTKWGSHSAGRPRGVDRTEGHDEGARAGRAVGRKTGPWAGSRPTLAPGWTGRSVRRASPFFINETCAIHPGKTRFLMNPIAGEVSAKTLYKMVHNYLYDARIGVPIPSAKCEQQRLPHPGLPVTLDTPVVKSSRMASRLVLVMPQEMTACRPMDRRRSWARSRPSMSP